MTAPRRSTARHAPTRRLCVGVVTGSRAEFGLLEPILAAMADSRRLQPRLIVTGMHLLRKFGLTHRDVRAAGFEIDARIRMQSARDDRHEQARAVSRGITGMARAFDDLGCRAVLVLGDRIEAFAAASAAVLTGRVLIHVHGGDRATGDLDDALRNAITRLAHVHLVASADAADRLRRMGETPDRIHRIGAPGLDRIRRFREQDRRRRRDNDERLRALLGPVAAKRYAIVLYHPCGRPAGHEARVIRATLRAVETCGLGGVVIYPNSDPGHEGIIRVIESLPRSAVSTPRGTPGSGSRAGRPEGRGSGRVAGTSPRGPARTWRVFRSLPHDDFLLVASRAALLVGNSSSGIIESASLGLPAVNVGPRQDGRLRCAPTVVDAGQSAPAIAGAIRRVLKSPPPEPARSCYGDGRAAERAVRVLERLIITPDLLSKRLAW